ncbi:hypothetical protein [Bacillus cereus]|uniref:hypothetical protein n=1 Tax=Bacillus cereus group TaxID=86661 RepID=UPI000BECFAF5|nr:hypothetical protein [Bacillus cereus]PEF15881.1 hypothetical protein CON87_27220 [Bacillus cereus]PET03777.1 hypothetical protein CN516_29285 [Bacillus cereus]PFP46017.1 hypothetical protein COJ98_23815 [Bacillus cereus]
MPFNNEKANKLSHNRILSNPIIKESLSKYKVTYDNFPEEASFLNKFIDIEKEDFELTSIFSVDGGFDVVPISDRFPNAQVGFIQFSMNLVRLNLGTDLVKNGFVNPIEFNRITEAHTQSLDLPIFNTKIGNYDNMIDSIRYRINEYFKCTRTFSDDSPNLLETLYEILSESEIIRNLTCINEECKDEYSKIRKNYKEDIQYVKENLFSKEDFNNENKAVKCPCCKKEILLIDYLRLHELVDDDFGSAGILSRLSKVIEHLYPINLIMSVLVDNKMEEDVKYLTLSKIGFIVDGPLAIFGEPAKLNRSIHRYINKVNGLLNNKGLKPLIYMGISKTGTVVDHINVVLDYMRENSKDENSDDKFNLPQKKFLIVDDEYRFKYIQPKMNNNLFGAETYYGQDIVYFNNQSQPYVISVLYPLNRTDKNFKENIFDVKTYTNLGRIGSLIEELKVDVYDNSLLPIVLAHRYASISLKPGVSSLAEFARAVIRQ